MENVAGVKIEGFSRMQICEGGKIVGNSGWSGPNRITTHGFEKFLAGLLAAQANSSRPNYIAIGTGGEPATNTTALAGEIMDSTKRLSASKATVTTSTGDAATARFYGTFASSDNFVTKAYNISNIALFYSTQTNQTLMAGNTYNSSQLSTNQDVQVTYEIRFGTA